VKGPGPLRPSKNPARDTAARSADRVGVAIRKSEMVPSKAGAPVGDVVGAAVTDTGLAVTGADVGAPGTGGAVGALVGALVGAFVGARVGANVGDFVGALVGADVILVSSPSNLKKASSKGFRFSAFKVLSEE
jgi:hypothetical protein